jgi:hypothetical protein
VVQEMNDQQAIQGLWPLVSYVSRGKKIHSSATHYLCPMSTDS